MILPHVRRGVVDMQRRLVSRAVLCAAFAAAGWAAGAAPWEVKEAGGVPALWRDGQPTMPIIFWQSYPLEYEVRGFSQAGVEIFSFFRSSQHYSTPYWKPDGSLDFAFLDGGIRELLRFNPRAYCLPRLFATAPQWWVEMNPREACRFASGQATTPPRESFASRKYLDEVGQAYRRAVRHILDADYGRQVLGIHVTNGPWGENFAWDALLRKGRPSGSDVSEPMRLALVDYTRAKYGGDLARLRHAWKDPRLTFETVQVPGLDQRKRTDAGAWRDPARSRAVMDYFECHNQVSVRMLDHFCRIVKQESGGRLLTVMFYGYTQDENWPIECDHRAISQLLRLKSVDMLSAPHTYYRRDLGGDAGMRQYLASTALHGKLFIDEGDDQTHLERLKPHPDWRAFAKTPEHTKALLYREFGNTVTHGVGLWYMDLNGGWFRDPSLIEAVGRMKKWAGVSINHSRQRNAQVAVISAPESEFYVGYRQSPNNEIGYGLYHDQMGELYRAGAPFDWYLIDDLDTVQQRDYKVYVFLDCFYLTESQRKTIKQLQSNRRTLIWFYAPGYASQEDLSQQRMEDLTGFRFQPAAQGTLKGVLAGTQREFGIDKTQKSLFTVMPGEGVRELATGVGELKNRTVLAEQTRDGWTSIFATVPGVPSDILGKIYSAAGVHRYIECDDPISANESWLMIHARTPGKKNVKLPSRYKKVTEITTERVLGEGIDAFTIELPQFATAVFLLEK
jgi:hypothetical protein